MSLAIFRALDSILLITPNFKLEIVVVGVWPHFSEVESSTQKAEGFELLGKTEYKKRRTLERKKLNVKSLLN